MAERSVAQNAKTANGQSSTLFLLAGLKLLDKMQQDEMIENVVKKHLLYAEIIQVRRRRGTPIIHLEKLIRNFVTNCPSAENKIAKEALYNTFGR